MAKPSRSKQPEFDPAELEDLIFSPAVGVGVGSHLLRKAEETALPAAADTLTTVVMPDQTVVTSVPTTVDTIVDEVTTVDATVLPTVVTSGLSLWTTEAGEFVHPSRVRPIRQAQDVLNAAEQSVYDTLWTAGRDPEGEDRAYRKTQAGYDYLMKRTGLSKKTIQRTIGRLLEKDFIEIDRPADIYHRTSTTYRVFSSEAVLQRHAAKGRFHAVKIGPGFLFVRPVDTSRRTTVVTTDSPTVAGINRQ